ncbi:YraN family protein [Streptacidiphilus rugosus]|uniref:YraN family protein n=1 Tax=Streptacidiphilus rugosus TaxID=405783 RepID=UPI00056A4016|nr:YraN family protein [Streptacidiphilus rugosus]
MTARTQALGRYGEQAAARHLEAAGLRVLARNWRCRAGELDIVALDPRPPGGPALAVCEVKTRSEHGVQSPAEAVGPAKAERLLVLAERWLAECWSGPPPPGGVRVDLICVVHGRRGPARITHLRGAVG